MLFGDRNPKSRKRDTKFDGRLQEMQAKATKLRTIDRQNQREHAKLSSELRAMLKAAAGVQEKQDLLNAIREEMIQKHNYSAEDADKALAIFMGKYKRMKI
jgi:hypothetical protein